jgi:hypothetical protein
MGDFFTVYQKTSGKPLASAMGMNAAVALATNEAIKSQN